MVCCWRGAFSFPLLVSDVDEGAILVVAVDIQESSYTTARSALYALGNSPLQQKKEAPIVTSP